MEYFILLIAHCFGDYTLQTKWMAENKHKFNLIGWIACLIHCLIYTATILIFFMLFQIQIKNYFLFTLLIFLSHFIPDKLSSITAWYVRKIRGIFICEGKRFDPEDIINLSISSIVYVVIDNSLHLFLMALILKRFLA